MDNNYISGEFHSNRNSYIHGQEPLIFHCHHYNIFLQMSIEDTKDYIDVYPILTDSAQEIAFSHFSSLFDSNQLTTAERMEQVALHFREAGFGIIDIAHLTIAGGTVSTPYEHYAIGWMSKWGERNSNEPGVSFFTSGFLAGAMEAIYGLSLGSMMCTQTKCLTKGDASCEFVIEKRASPVDLKPSIQEGTFQTFDYYPEPSGINVDYSGVRDALTQMAIVGDQNDGMINAFGVMLTRHYANYYNRISMKTMIAMEKVFGQAGVKIVQDLLVEAGHVCAFNTFGGIMLSSEWNALIKPNLQNKEDWAHGITACINALGWGLWEIKDLDSEGPTTFKITSAYESNGLISDYDKLPSYFINCFLEGGVSGIMNLIYHGDITQNPELNEEFYNKTFKTAGKYKTVPLISRTKGSDFDEFMVIKG